MNELIFPYLKFDISTPFEQKPEYIYRLVIPLGLISIKKVIPFPALIDSGADVSIFPGWLADESGFDIYKGKEKMISGIGGTVVAFLYSTKILLSGFEFTIDVYYSHEWDNMPFGLLGQSGFFSHFEVNFNYKEKFVQLNSYS